MESDTKWSIGIVLVFVLFMSWAGWAIVTKPTDEEEHRTFDATNDYDYHVAQINTPADILVVLEKVSGVPCSRGYLQWKPCYYGDPTWHGTPFAMTWYGKET